MKALDLFCGLGGWSDGLAMEGFEVLGVEIESKIAKLYKHPVIVADVRTLDGENLKGYDLIVGSPPCRDFSLLTNLGYKFWKDPPNPERGLTNMNAFLRIVNKAKPRYWLMENVPRLEKHLELKPKVRKAKLTRTMKRNFWGEFPSFLIPMDANRKQLKKVGHPEHNIKGSNRKWIRAKIPLPVARALGKAIMETEQ